MHFVYVLTHFGPENRCWGLTRVMHLLHHSAVPLASIIIFKALMHSNLIIQSNGSPYRYSLAF